MSFPGFNLQFTSSNRRSVLPQGPVETGKAKDRPCKRPSVRHRAALSFSRVSRGVGLMGFFIGNMYHVYELEDPSGWIFYVGKGNKERLDVQRRGGDKKDRAVTKYVNRVKNEGGCIKVRIVFSTEDETEAFAKERERIAFHGKENLLNKADGGRGPTGVPQSEEAKLAASKRFKGVKKSPEHCIRISAGLKGIVRSEEHRQKLSEARKGKPRGPRTWEYRLKMSKLVKERLAIKRDAKGLPPVKYPRSNLSVNPGEIITTPRKNMRKRINP